MNSMTTLIPSKNNRKRRRVDVIGFCTARNHEAALQANDSQNDGNKSQDGKDTLRNHERVLQIDEVAGGGPGEAYQDMFSKLDLIWHRLRVLVEQPLSSRNALSKETERRAVDLEIGNLKASLGQLEQEAGVRYRFKSKEEIMDLVENEREHPYVCPAADCERSYKRKDRLHEHIRKECDLKECSREHKFLYDLIYKPFCFQCRKSFTQRRFTIHVRDIHGDRSTPWVELFQEFLPSMTQDYDPDAPDIDNADKHRQASVMDVTSTRVEESSPSSSSRCSETAPDACSAQPHEEQHIFCPSWVDSDFTVPQEQHIFRPSWINTDFTTPQEQHAFGPLGINSDFAMPEERQTFDPLWISTDFTTPQEQHALDPSGINSGLAVPQEQQTFDTLWTNSDFMIPKEDHTFVPVWTDSRSSVKPSSPQQTGGKSVESYPPHAAASTADFTDANIQGRSEADHDDNRLSGPRYESNDFQYAIRDNPSPIDLSWTPYKDQATTQGLEDNQQHSILGLSQIDHTQTPQEFGSIKSPSVTQALAAAKAEEATWQEVLSIRRRTEDLKRIAQTGRRTQSPIAQGDGVYCSRHPQKLHGHPYLQGVRV